MSSLFFDNINVGFCMADDDDVCYPLNGLVEDSSIPPHYPYYNLEAMDFQDEYAVVMDFQDHHHLDQDLDITTTENISEFLMDPILDGEISTTTSDHVSVDEENINNNKGCFPSYHHHQPSISSVHGDDQLLRLNHESMVTSDTTPPPSLVFLPTEDMDNELSVFHLLMAYAEAMEMGQEELAEVIGKRIGDKVSPVGDTILERLIYYMFQTLENKQSDYYYLKQESLKNFCPAFRAFYQMLPNGKFAHFVANLAILEALPSDATVIRIFDFDIGEGIQWASLIGATIINNAQQQIREIILTSVKLNFNDGDHYRECSSSLLIPKFEDTKRRLCDYAMPYGLELKVEEIELRDLGRCLTNIAMQDGGGRRDQWFVFNCMVGLPHMGRVRSRKNVVEFLESAQNFLQRYDNSVDGGGVVILGDGDAWEEVRNASSYGAFLEGNMAHYQALLESIKHNFPIHLGEARTAMECLFVAPFVSSRRWGKQWEEKKKKNGDLEARLMMSLEGWKLRQDRIMEAVEMVRSEGGESSQYYGVKIMEGESSNEIVMDWRGIPMVKVSCWRS